MNDNFEKYIEGLSPELQEKARACKTKEELNAFIADNDLELPEEALELVSGGCGTSTPKPKKYYCKKCGREVSKTSIPEGIGSSLKKLQDPNYKPTDKTFYICWNCGNLKEEDVEYR